MSEPKSLWQAAIDSAAERCEKCGKALDEHPTVNVEGVNTLALCQDRAIKWQRVQPGTVIPAGQPYRREFDHAEPELACEYVESFNVTATESGGAYFVDSLWRPPLELPTEACVIRANLKHGGQRILFGHPNPGEEQGMTFCRSVDGLGYTAAEIVSFEGLWEDR